jgi:hypothetical protein
MAFVEAVSFQEGRFGGDKSPGAADGESPASASTEIEPSVAKVGSTPRAENSARRLTPMNDFIERPFV